MDGPVVMSGHQAGAWHCGIAAKVLAMWSVARARGGTAAWVVVDQDVNDPTVVSLPIRSTDGATLERAEWRLGVAQGAGRDVPTCRRGAIERIDPADELLARGALPQVAEGARLMTAKLQGARGTLAEQFGAGAIAALEEMVGEKQSTKIVSASGLSRTDLFGELLRIMASDPSKAVGTYNAAAARLRVSGIGPLGVDEARGRFELPLWRVTKERGAARTRVWSDSFDPASGEYLPRALLMTGMLRGCGCEMFIHGRGGGATGERGGYDKVTEMWMREWLGWELAPSVVVSADVFLPLGAGPVVSERDVAEAVARAHRARHSPGMLGDEGLEQERARLVEVLTDDSGGTGWGKAARRAAFVQLHSVLSRARERQGVALAVFERRVVEMKAQRAREKVAGDRGYCFAFHGAEAVSALNDRVARLVAGAGTGT